MIRLEKIRKSKAAKVFALALAFEFTAQLVNPEQLFALTTGPSQPEMLSFEPIGTSEMVNVFSGDFTYNIPLMDVGGYPINLSYNSGITTDQEASWVGLGWNINPGAITRSMRGLPDDFNGDLVTKRFNMKPNRTYSASTTLGTEAFGFAPGNLNYSVTMSYNNYTGVGYQQTLNMTFNSGEGAKGPLSAGLGVTAGNGGLDLTPSVSYGTKIAAKDNDVKGTGKLGLSMNSRSGLKALSLSASVTEKANLERKIDGSDEIENAGHRATLSANGGSSFSFASPTYTPQVTMPMVNTSFSVSFKPGADFFGADVTGDIAGSYSEQKLERTSQSLAAYGYLNSQAGVNDDYAMHDFNREKDGTFTENTPSLPITNYTYDVYAVNGQGIGGSYRPFRSDLGYVYDSRNTTTNFSGNLGIELSSGNLVHGGVDVTITDVNTTSKRWTDDNSADDALKFKGQADISSASYKPLYEPFYFKEGGEKSVDSDPALFNSIGGDQPIRIELNHVTPGLNVVATDKYRIDAGAGVTLPSLNYRSARQRRNQAITLLTVAEARRYGLQRSFYSSGISPSAKDHHVGEITTLRSDGTRYVFGVPAYNLTQQEATFNVQGRSTCVSKGLVSYSTGDNSVGNVLGIDNYFSETELPAYAHSYLLTAVLSSDYVDYDNIEGPSAGDLGSYTKFNYVKAAPLFKWRTPIDINTRSANYNEGLKSDPADDKGSYVYGEKEIWYVNSIETKTYVAVFTLSDRNDGLGVNDKDGTVNTSVKLKKIDKISLYSKPDYDANGANATPIKVANFVYDYSLCPGIPNSTNGGGKLTLTKLYFTYGKSYKARLSGYEFKYADLNHDGTQDVNYGYNQKGSDRWGNYANNPFASCTTAYSSTSDLGPWEYPYTDQNKSTLTGHVAPIAAENAAAWSMTDIELPSGGTISVDYESDDYAFVQDKRATQMFKVTDFRINHTGYSVDPSTISSINTGVNPADLNIYDNSGYPKYVGTDYYLFFKLQTNLPTTTPGSDLVRDYLADQKTNIYFRFLTDITNSGDYEYVSGYFDLDYVSQSNTGMGLVTTSGLLSNGLSQYGWMRLKKVPIGDRDNTIAQDVNPVVKATWQFGRLHLSRKVWGEPDPQGNGVEQVVTALANSNMAQNIIEFFKGPNRTIRDKGYGRTAIMNKSWVRMNNPDGYKYGGGSRVKKIAIKDNWKYMVTTNNSGTTTPNSALPTDYDASYGQEYSYTTTDPSNSSKTISSGVASYEPALGGDENPFHEPVYFSEDRKLVPDDQSYIEKPYGESFFPSPGVGYSKVTVKSLANSSDNGNGQVTRHNTGYTVQEFYTAYDFPTITRVGWMEVQHWRTNPILSLLRIDMKDYLTASQGFVVELNDMHGKPKAVTVYEQGKTTPLSQVKYFYKTDADNAKHLDNTVLAIGKDGQATEQICGMDYDFVADMREQETKMISAGARMNMAVFVAGILPGVVPTIIPSWSSEHTRFRSAGTTKVINRYGILVKTEATDAGGTATTENLAWDKETGEVLLTKTYTNYEDAVYNFAYPAHWAYDRMGQAYKNVGATFTGSLGASGSMTFTSLTPNQYFVKGDEVAIESGSTWIRAWVCNTSSTDITVMDIAGGTSLLPAQGTYNVKIIRSGRRNMQAVSVGSVITRTNPLKDINADQILDLYFENVLNAGSVEFAEQWSIAPGKTSTVGCSCALTSLGTQFANMLNTLAENKKLTVFTTLLSNGVYSYGYTADLNAPRATPAPTSMTWNATGTTTNVMIGTMSGGAGVTDCQTTLTLPSDYNWGQVIGLSNIQPTTSNCSASTSTFSGSATLQTASGIIIVTFTGTTGCYTMGNCSSTTTCGVQSGQTINPYYHNVLGNWRMLKNYLYLSERSQDVAGPNNDNLDLRNNGVFVTRDQSTGNIISYQPFWSPNSGNDWTKNSTYWTWAQEVTKYTPFGNEVENKDALGRYSAAVFGYNHTLPIAVASNSRYQDVGYDGFEDYAFITQDCRELHFSFYGSGTPVTTQAHTGLYSMQVNTSSAVTMTRNLATTTSSLSSASCNFTVAAGDMNSVFAPYTGGGARTFIVNYWVKEGVPSGTPAFNYAGPVVEIWVNSVQSTLTLVQKSGIIEGWQQYQYSFNLTASQSGPIEIKLKNNGAYTTWFDDIRIMPAEANMVTYVYHPINQRLTYQLDENNYATIYEYDEEGALVRIKKETERGIVTIKESRNNSYHR